MCWVYPPCVLGPQRQYLCCASDCCVSPPSYLIREPNFRLCIFDYSDRRQHSALLTSALRWGTPLAFSNLEILLECKREQNKRYLQEIKIGGSKVVFSHCGWHTSAQPSQECRKNSIHRSWRWERERESRERPVAATMCDTTFPINTESFHDKLCSNYYTYHKTNIHIHKNSHSMLKTIWICFEQWNILNSIMHFQLNLSINIHLIKHTSNWIPP